MRMARVDKNGYLECPRCGGGEIEEYGQVDIAWRHSRTDPDTQTLHLDGDWDWHESESDGLRCRNCYSDIELPEGWEVSYD